MVGEHRGGSEPHARMRRGPAENSASGTGERGRPNSGEKRDVRGVVVVTGATAGVGRATAREFARRGYAIALLARGQEALRRTREELAGQGAPALSIPTDVADHRQVEAAATRTIAELGPIDLWVNNAMTGVFAPLWELAPEEFRRVTEVTYLGAVYGTLVALNHMRERGEGRIVQVGSALGYRGIPLQSAYCGAKHGLQGFTESLRAELRHEHSPVTVTMVQLPGLNTPQFRQLRSKMRQQAQPMPPIYQPEVAARAIVWAAEHRRPEMWVGSSTVGTIIANRLAPRLLDHYLGRTGYAGQLIEEPHDPTAPGNLFEPVEGDHGAHGPYDARARASSTQLALSERRGLVTGAVLAGAAGTAACTAAVVRRLR